MAHKRVFDKWDGIHLALGGLGVATAAIGLAAGIGPLSALAVAGVNVYAIVILWECAKRADTPGDTKWQLPHVWWSVVQSFLLILTAVIGFANLYLVGNAVQYQGPGANPSTPTYLSDASDAIYFAFLTLGTQGFGDYVPANGWARFYVSWELFTTILLVFLILPLVLNKVGGYTVGAAPASLSPAEVKKLVDDNVKAALQEFRNGLPPGSSGAGS